MTESSEKRFDARTLMRLWTSGSNILKNSTQPYFWYDSYQPLNTEVFPFNSYDNSTNCVLVVM